MKKIIHLTDQKLSRLRFINQFNVDEATSTVCLNAQLCYTLGIFERLLISKKLKYQDFGITDEYYKKFKTMVIKGLDNSVKELQEFSKIIPLNDGLTTKEIDYNTLDYLEGLIKSAVENEIISWKQIGFENIDSFNELLESIREQIDACTINNFLDTEANFLGLEQFETDGKINGDYNQWPDDLLVRDPSVIKIANRATEQDHDFYQPIDDADLDIICQHCLTSVPYLKLKLPE